jgi:TolB-like protein/DNA-binding winged helix-turn-helix (wHTH) protein
MSDTIEAPLWIGEWRLDPLASTLTRGDQTVPVDQRSLQLLLCLSKQPGRVVTTDELLDQVWPDVTVGQDSVYQAIAGLRRSLGDDSRKPAYIATVPRKGYRLIAQVSHGKDLTEVKPVEVPALPRNRRTAMVAAALAAIAVIAFFLLGPMLQAKTDVSMAVLPFLDMTSQSMEEEYLADGVTEELINRLSAVPGFHVASPTTSFGLKGKDIALGDLAKQLGVTYVLDGSLREADGRRRVSVRLVRGKDGIVLWTNSYDSTDKDVLALQDNIAMDVAAAMKKKLSPVIQ